MKMSSKSMFRNLLFAGLAAVMSGCIVINIKVGVPRSGANKDACCGDYVAPPISSGRVPSPPDGQGEGEHEGDDSGLPGDPTGNFGTVSIDTANAAQGSSGYVCFPLTQGWDKYYVLPGRFEGPNKTCNLPNYPNTTEHGLLWVGTCNASNLFWGNTLETGIVIHRDTAPNIKQCRTNALACAGNTKLTTNRFAMQAYCYRAVVYYKSSTLAPGQTNIHVEWRYE